MWTYRNSNIFNYSEYVNCTQKRFLPLFSKLRAVLHKTVARKIVKTVPSIKISHGWTERNGPCSSFFKILTSFFRLFILLNLKQLRTNTICIVDLVSIFVQLLTVYLHIVLTMRFVDGTVSLNSQRELWRVQRVVMKIVVIEIQWQRIMENSGSILPHPK